MIVFFFFFDQLQGADLTVTKVETLPETCVTVFGFLPDEASSVLSAFHKHGFILRFHGWCTVVDVVGTLW